MKELFAAQASVLRYGSTDEKQIVGATRLPGLTIFEKVLIVVILIVLTTFCVVLGWVSREPVAGPVFWLFIVQPFLLGVYAQRGHRRNGTIWGLLTLGMNIGIIAFFEVHMPAYWREAIAEFSLAELMSAIIIITTLALLRNHRSAAGRSFATNLRSGLFRVWVVSSGLWLIVCAIQFYLHCSRYDCKFFVGMGHSPVNYLDIGELFVGIPALAFVIGLAACWAIDGFRIRAHTDSTESPTGRYP
jgi:hypothetical protein